MKKFTLFFMTMVLTMVSSLASFAAEMSVTDDSDSKAENGYLRVKSASEYTGSAADLDGKTFVLVDAATGDNLLYNHDDVHDMTAGKLSNLNGDEYIYTKFAKVTKAGVEGNIYTMQMFNKDGVNFKKYGTQGYVNFQPAGQNIVFSLGLGDGTKYGQDCENGALWDVQAEDGGFVIKNVNRNNYFNHSVASASIADKAYFKFYGEVELYKETNELEVKVTTNANAYDDVTVNGINAYKAGTSKAVGSFDLTVPAGAKYIKLSALAWKGANDQKLILKKGESVVAENDIIANDGITGNSPFTLVDEPDAEIVIDLGEATTEETTFTITCEKRFVMWNIIALKKYEAAPVEPVDPVDPTPAAVIVNNDFKDGVLGEVNIATYAKDGEVNQMQEVPGWSFGVENGDARAAGVVAYGSATTIGGSDYKVPAEGPEGTNGNALALVGVWTGTVKYVQNVTLPAGNYVLSVPVYNYAGTTAFVKNLIGVTIDDKEYFAATKNYAVGEWKTENISFTLEEEKTVTVSLGYEGANVGSAASQHLFIDRVDLEKTSEVEVAIANINKDIEAIEATIAKYPVGDNIFMYAESEFTAINNAIADAKAAATAEGATKESIATASENLANAVSAFAPKMTAPKADQAYTLTLPVAENAQLSISTEDGIRIKEEGTAVYFAEQEDGTFAISNGTEYVAYLGSNTWSMTAGAEAYGWTISPVDGGYTINGKNGLLGTNAADKAAGSACYGNKTTANGNCVWAIAAIAPEVPELAMATVDITETDGVVTVASDNAEYSLVVIAKTTEWLDEGETPEDALNSQIEGIASSFESKEQWEGTLPYMGFDFGSKTITIADYQEINGGKEMFVIAANVAWNEKEGKVTLASNTKTYNFTVPAAPEPEPAIAAGDYFLYNVEAKAWLGGANSWGTQGSVVAHPQRFTVAVNEDGTYTLDSHTYNSAANHFFGTNLYVDSPAANWTINAVDGGYTLSAEAGKFVASAAESTVIETVDDMNNPAAVWKIYSEADMIKALEEGEMTDATFAIKAAGFGRNLYGAKGSETAWIIEEGCTNKNLNGGANENMCAESYHSPFNIHQIITGMPNGKYTFKAQGFYRQDGEDTENMPVFYANGASQVFPEKTGSENSMTDASNSFTEGLYTIDAFEFEVTDGTIDLGVKNENATLWCIWDNIEIAIAKETPAITSVDITFDAEEGAEIDLAETKSIHIAIACPEGIEKDAELLINGAIIDKDGNSTPVTAFTDFEDCTDAAISQLTPGETYTLVINKVAFGEVIGVEDDMFTPIYKNTIVAEEGSSLASLTFSIKVEAEPVDPSLIEIAQTCDTDQNMACSKVEGEGYTEYTTGGDVSLLFKMLNVDVNNCDYILIKFAEAVPEGIKAAFWNGQEMADVPAGATEYKYVFADDANCAIKDNVLLPQVTLLTLWNAGKVVKVEGVYKHVAEEVTAIESTESVSASATKKMMVNGKLVIVKGNKTYNVAGALVK